VIGEAGIRAPNQSPAKIGGVSKQELTVRSVGSTRQASHPARLEFGLLIWGSVQTLP
jgi:hypothetical protein